MTSSETISSTDPRYPPLLGQIPRPPQNLYLLGAESALSLPTISVVGSRKMSGYAEKVLRLLVPDLVGAGLAVVSGLAYGVDGYAHRYALQCGGTCLAVMAGGLDRVYPVANRPLFHDILAQGGAAVSEFAEGTPLTPALFAVRNRIIAGLSPVLLIVEAGERSGTLITARCALEAGREVCVVPGDITRPQSQGVLSLLKQGAHPVGSAGDVLALYDRTWSVTVPPLLKPALTGSPATLYDLISCGETTLEELERASGMAVNDLQSVLSVLELDGYIALKGTEWQITS